MDLILNEQNLLSNLNTKTFNDRTTIDINVCYNFFLLCVCVCQSLITSPSTNCIIKRD